MRLYFTIVILLAIIAGIYGLLVPFLISMKDTIAVISGFALPQYMTSDANTPFI